MGAAISSRPSLPSIIRMAARNWPITPCWTDASGMEGQRPGRVFSGGRESVFAWLLQGLAGPGHIVCPDDHAGVRGQISEKDVDAGVRQSLHDHGQLARPVGHREDDDFQLALDLIATRTQTAASGAWIAGQYMHHAFDLRDALDVDSGSTEHPDNASQGSRAVLRQPYGQVSRHWEEIVCRGICAPLPSEPGSAARKYAH